MKTYHLYIPGIPRSKGNSGRILKRGKRRFIAPSAVSVKAEKSAREHIAEQWGRIADFSLTGPIDVRVVFLFNPPKKGPVHSFCLRKVDRGNLLKLIEDAGNGIVWIDDSQIVSGDVAKQWTNKDFPEPQTIVSITPL